MDQPVLYNGICYPSYQKVCDVFNSYSYTQYQLIQDNLYNSQSCVTDGNVIYQYFFTYKKLLYNDPVLDPLNPLYDANFTLGFNLINSDFYEVNLPFCTVDEIGLTSQNSLPISYADGAELAFAVVAVWALAWGFKVIRSSM